jgi:hypothetical protein
VRRGGIYIAGIVRDKLVSGRVRRRGSALVSVKTDKLGVVGREQNYLYMSLEVVIHTVTRVELDSVRTVTSNYF